MKSKISKTQHDDIIRICKRMKPAERLVAFFNHSRLMMQIYQAGVDFRHHSPNAPNQKGSPKNHES